MTEISLQTVITCPECGHRTAETMPEDACQFFYDCKKCAAILKPQPGECCVYCSYGSIKCPPVQVNDGQAGEACCG